LDLGDVGGDDDLRAECDLGVDHTSIRGDFQEESRQVQMSLHF